MSDPIRNPVLVVDQNAGTLERLRRTIQLFYAFIYGTYNAAACVCQVNQTTKQRSYMLLEVPDKTKDYILAYDSSDGFVKWIETTEDCTKAA